MTLVALILAFAAGLLLGREWGIRHCVKRWRLGDMGWLKRDEPQAR
jgi:hypothetical protein